MWGIAILPDCVSLPRNTDFDNGPKLSGLNMSYRESDQAVGTSNKCELV